MSVSKQYKAAVVGFISCNLRWLKCALSLAVRALFIVIKGGAE